MNRFIVATDDQGVPSAQIPLPLLAHLAKRFPAETLVAAYHYETNHVLISFPGSDAPTVQQHLDDLVAGTAVTTDRLATWPGLHSGESEFPDAHARHRAAPAASTLVHDSAIRHAGDPTPTDEFDVMTRRRDPIGNPSTVRALSDMQAVLESLTPAQQDRLTVLVCQLQNAVAAERLCYYKLFEAAPDGYVSTDFGGRIHHANDAMYQLLQLNAPYLDGLPLLTFFTPSSQSLVLQRLRLLRTGISECQPYTDVQAHMTLTGDRVASVSMRLIAIPSHDSSLSTIRWLIRHAP